MIESNDRLAIVQGQKTVERTYKISIKCMIGSMNRIALRNGQKIVETTVRVSKKRLNVWIDWL